MTDPLDMTIDHTRDDLRRADATAGAIIFFTLGLGGIIADAAGDLPRVVVIAATFAAVPATVTIRRALAVVRPRMIDDGEDAAPASWPHADRQEDGDAVLAAIDSADPRQIKAAQEWSLAKIAAAKNREVPRAISSFVVTVQYLAAVAVVSALVYLVMAIVSLISHLV